MKKIFIYYSLTGNGEVVSDYLKDKKIDIRKVNVDDKMPKNNILRIIVGGYYAMKEFKPKLIDFDNNISKYDEIIIGSPIWNDRISCPILSVLDKLDLKNKTVTFILYSGSGNNKKGSFKIKELFPKGNIINLKEPKKNKDELNKLDSL